jgi:hypothetical protein
MPHKIPKLQWKNYQKTGNTNSNTTISGMNNTTNLEAGMTVKGSGIQSGTTIVSVDSATQITITPAATATASGVTLDFYYEISFTYPPVEKGGEKLDSKERVSVSVSGQRQVSVDYIEATRAFDFRFLSESEKTTLQTFFTTWGYLGKIFRYFDDNTLTSYIEYELNDLKFDPKKIAPKGGICLCLGGRLKI